LIPGEWHLSRAPRELLAQAIGAGAAGEELADVRAAAREALSGAELAGLLVVCDLLSAGWTVTLERSLLDVAPPAESDRESERGRVRAQLTAERDRQLVAPAVQRFLRRMESPRRCGGALVSVLSLMRDGRPLAQALAGARGEADLSAAIRPYVQLARVGDRCEHTGLDMAEIWRYFRHTWLTPYRSTPGRGAMFLVRDEAAPRHPVIGIAMLGSAAAQISDRDRWIGWDAERVVAECRDSPSEERAAWLSRTLDEEVSQVEVVDLLADGVLEPSDLRAPSAAAVGRLREEIAVRRRAHARYGDATALREVPDDEESWAERSRSPLFRGKRAELLAVLLEARATVADALRREPAVQALRTLAASEDGRRAIRIAARRSKASRMGTALADIQVCGAVSPYRELLGGKLVAALLTGREVRELFEARYSGQPSVIASSVAGRRIVRDARLAALTTTSLFGHGSSQYNRLLGRPGAGECGAFLEIGRTAGFGSVHLGQDTAAALSEVLSAATAGRRVFSLFGEGVSPRLRQLRQGLDLLGLPSQVILRHGARRTVYVVPLARNARRYLCGLDAEPDFPGELAGRASSDAIAASWRERWLRGRVGRQGVLESVSQHTLERPVTHGARALALPGADG
jgi:hypothetical protein